MRKTYMKRTIKFVALILPIVLIVLLLQNFVFVYRDSNAERIRKFYAEEENSLDVVLLGASEITAGYSPGYAYDKYGYTSYMYAFDGNVAPLFTAQLKEVLEHQNPDLIIVEVFGFIRPIDSLSEEAKLRTFTENIPNSSNKWNTIMDFNYDNKISCVFPFIKYHGDVELAGNYLRYLRNYHDTIGSPSVLKGMTTQTVIHNGDGEKGVADPSNNNINDIRKTYLIEFMEYCREKGLDNVIFVNFPRDIDNEPDNDLLSRVKHVQQIVTEQGFDFIDFQEAKEQIGLDMCADFYNAHHLNVYGQQKLTEHLGNIIVNQYHLVPREQGAENQAHWKRCAAFAKEYFSIADELTTTGVDRYILTDAELLPYLDPETASRMRDALS